jgi:hypothetical protein
MLHICNFSVFLLPYYLQEDLISRLEQQIGLLQVNISRFPDQLIQLLVWFFVVFRK